VKSKEKCCKLTELYFAIFVCTTNKMFSQIFEIEPIGYYVCGQIVACIIARMRINFVIAV